MKLKSQLSSLALSQRLKEIGVKQESLFYNYLSNESIMKSDVDKKFWYLAYKHDTRMRNCERVSAFTVAELGEMLPINILKEGNYWWFATRKNTSGSWVVVYETNDESFVEHGDTEADARAKMLIYLLENGLITL